MNEVPPPRGSTLTIVAALVSKKIRPSTAAALPGSRNWTAVDWFRCGLPPTWLSATADPGPAATLNAGSDDSASNAAKAEADRTRRDIRRPQICDDPQPWAGDTKALERMLALLLERSPLIVWTEN